MGRGQSETLFKIIDGRYFAGYFGRKGHILHSMQLNTKYLEISTDMKTVNNSDNYQQ